MLGFLDGVIGSLAGLNVVMLSLIAGMFVVAETSMLIGLLVPGDAVVLLAGSAVSSPGGFALLVTVCTLGCLAGESIGYLVGRRLGPRVTRCRFGRWIGAANWARAEAFLRRRGGPAVFASRFVAVIHALVPVVAGVAGMPYRRFIAWATAAAACWSSLYAAAGAAAGATYRAYGGRLTVTGTALAGMAVGGVLLACLVRGRVRRQRRLAAAAEDDTCPNSPREAGEVPAGLS